VKAIRALLSRQAVLAAVAGFWVLAVAIGALAGLKYAGTPGRLAAPPDEWPANVLTRSSSAKQTLLIFLHPECPCSHATVEELARLMAMRGGLEALVIFFDPSGVPEWRRSDLHDSARRIPGVQVIQDRDGFIGQHFGARTSGQVLLYDSRGLLLFNGGITATRGHIGPNDGFDAIVAVVHGEVPTVRKTPVFGCALYGDN
jgi:hypothetical protein